ncbi:hypothetical protein GH714_016102 [Hevea brasiliensis]|uniref:Disease resistance protein At4g27190-like leucine-rich repeats domain-containing protein n=1 Tax=Hevea brasiliensis TaxID=3981 RepID=A0A6A6N228_HEVBR|nr:hypothetical protein GH714_016102 [Hevea brasiliensis]
MLKMKISVSQSISSCSSVSPSQLKILQIENIEDLEVLPEDLWHLPSLEGLLIKACEELDLSDDIQWQYLRSLREFQLINMNKLAFLPKGLQHVSTLRKLSIESCPNLKSLPEWMESLTAIEALWIEECPQLSERCKNNLGADWPKIAHIPNISIDDRWINDGDSLSSFIYEIWMEGIVIDQLLFTFLFFNWSCHHEEVPQSLIAGQCLS